MGIYTHSDVVYTPHPRRGYRAPLRITRLPPRTPRRCDPASRRGYCASRRRRYALTADTSPTPRTPCSRRGHRASSQAPHSQPQTPCPSQTPRSRRGRRVPVSDTAPHRDTALPAAAHTKSIRQLPDAFLCLLFLFLCFFFKAKLGVEYLFAQSDGFGSDLYKLVLADKLDRLLKAHDPRRNKSQCLVRTA